MWADRAHDERRHEGAPVETWQWWGSTADEGGVPVVAWFVGLELRGRRFDYWAGLARAGHPYLYVEELDGTGLRGGLELKPPEMWAGHDCDVPFVQWSLGNEAHGVLLDDPDEVFARAFGQRSPMTMDIEWYGLGAATSLEVVAGADGYEQAGEFDAQFETEAGVLSVTGHSHRVHVWGVPWRPVLDESPRPAGGLQLPYRRHDGTAIDQVVTAGGWWARTVAVR